jgi:plasmid stability protein
LCTTNVICESGLIHVSFVLVPKRNQEEYVMPSLTIKGIPDDLMAQLRQRAAEHRRSLNSEVLVRLEKSVAPTRIDPNTFLARVRALQKRVDLPPLTDRLLEQAVEEGRP